MCGNKMKKFNKAYKLTNEYLMNASKELDKAEDAIRKINPKAANIINSIGLKICKAGIALCTEYMKLEKK